MQANIQSLLEQAQQMCETRGARFTITRKKVLELMLKHGGAISAYDLLDKLKETDTAAKPPTVYRALDFLLEQHFIHRVESQNAFIACNDFSDTHQLQLFICEKCQEVQEIHSPQIQQSLNDQARLNDFQIKTQTVEARGLCHHCRVD
ncbi:transcriptional repressor [Psychrobium sp. 1_MG-2023]|uniref:transcriptional repressor n=1 Tax=Psychrobium sp. 1_MG-2023 TaxID=3062624 RepID=UPI000C322D52|nr:transcriptional repressor [Psychrobium sp. 1_MG-2023]MDP2561499.1 transcriptional repressor [Psychrobium sp. 1_MG-2023]PKF57765.1 transcriptional repressor [Alteromonadales bacterium alter-6D02]